MAREIIIFIEETNCRPPPRRGRGRHLTELEKKKRTKTPLLVNSKTKDQGKITGKPKHKAPSR